MVVARLAGSERQLKSVHRAKQAGHALARHRPNLVVPSPIFNVGMLQTPGGQGGAAAVGTASPRTSFPNARAPRDDERKNLLIASRIPISRQAQLSWLLSRPIRLPEAAAVQEQIDAIIRPGIELSLGRRHTEAEGAALRQ
jgi:hypothetical protein